MKVNKIKLGSVCVCAHTPAYNLLGGRHYYPHFTDKETESDWPEII